VTRAECEELIDAYLSWLRKGLSAEKVGDACELTTPFLDRHNDHLQIYATRRNGVIVLSDDGYILSDLRSSGLDLDTPKRMQVVQTILNGFGIRQDGNQLVVEASGRNLGQKVHSLLQGMLAINDTFVMAQSRVASFFWEDVKAFLDENDVRYNARVKISGRSGYDHAIDFLIPHSRSRPERFVQAINAPSKNTISAYLFALNDSREARPARPDAYAFLNDRDRAVAGDVVEALEAYEVKPALWSHRSEFVEALAG
jgi:hypothetical protein